jgi:UDP-N-acetylglucosamine--N-acetylmuramyl-(pentapeptide) pyrophosphoryl-undecaprenol N-acetylglucosamine transferase
MYRIAIVAGGSGGHIFPGIALAQALAASEKVGKIVFIGRKDGLEKEMASHYGFSFYGIKADGLIERNLLKKFKGGFKIVRGLTQSLSILRSEGIQLVLGTGGYVSVPVVIAARCLHIPIILHEQNAIVGKANRFLSRWAEKICITFPSSIGYFSNLKCLVTGNPVRQEILALKQKNRETNFVSTLILGGSQGASAINKAMETMWPYLKPYQSRLTFFHQTGEKDFLRIKEYYKKEKIAGNVFSFMKDIASCYAQADLVISRAGATTLAEITALGLPSILIPYPWAKSHQLYNAKQMEKIGAAIVIPQEELTGKGLADIFINLVLDKDRLKLMAKASRAFGRPQATNHIKKICIQTLERKENELTMA